MAVALIDRIFDCTLQTVNRTFSFDEEGHRNNSSYNRNNPYDPHISSHMHSHSTKEKTSEPELDSWDDFEIIVKKTTEDHELP